jgi:CBS domain-containing protein
MMAMTDQWRQPLGRWRQYFHRWIDVPEPEALMLTGVFLDQRFVYGRADLIDGLRAEVVLRAQANKGFLAALAGQCPAAAAAAQLARPSRADQGGGA